MWCVSVAVAWGQISVEKSRSPEFKAILGNNDGRLGRDAVRLVNGLDATGFRILVHLDCRDLRLGLKEVLPKVEPFPHFTRRNVSSLLRNLTTKASNKFLGTMER